MAKKFMRLDNSANIYPMMVNKQNQNLFRMSVELKEIVDPKALQQAVDLVLPRFKCLTMKLMRGFFWYYLAENNAPYTVKEEDGVPLSNISLNNQNGYNLRICYYKNRISMEVYHVVCDGAGGVELLKSILHAYFLLTGRLLPTDGILAYNTPVGADESEDSFIKNFVNLPIKDLKVKSLQGKKAFILDGEYYGYGKNITRLFCSAAELLQAARARSATVTELLTAVYGQSIIDVYGEQKLAAQIMLPINLRKMFNSRSLRNFSLFSRVELPLNVGLDEHIAITKKSLQRDMDKDLLQNKICTTVKAEKILIFRLTPLFIKRAVFMISNLFFGKGKRTATISNMGVVRLPEEFAQYVDNFNFQVNSNKNTPINIAAGSYGDKMSICFTNALKDNSLIEAFVKRLAEMGVQVVADSNYWGLIQ